MTMTREEQIKEAARQRADQYDHPAYYGFIDGAKWADSHTQLIPVEKKLPKENERIIAYNGVFNEVHLCDYHDSIF